MVPVVEVDRRVAAKLVLGLECPKRCGGRIQTYIRPEISVLAACYRCGEAVDLGTVGIIYGEDREVLCQTLQVRERSG